MRRLRIVAGEFGGRWITAPRGRSVRPTREMVREAWFNALGDRVNDSIVVDLFAGSGALGLEALSRGARRVDFVETDRGALRALRDNVGELEVERRGRVHAVDVARFLDRLSEGEPGYDVALADPPYETDWGVRLAEIYRERPFARLLCLEHATGELPEESGVTWRREYGDTTLTFLAPSDAPGKREVHE